jgi:hypothetical protein
MPNGVDITNLRFGRLVVRRRASNTARGKRRWLCQCDCGRRKIINGEDLRAGKTKSCGCWQRQSRKSRMTTHGHSNSAEYAVWANMLTRCNNPRSSHFNCYGGRGIKVSQRWFQYENFIADMGHRPSSRYSLDRVDVNGDYEPSNCRWATKKTQTDNRRPYKMAKLENFSDAELEAELARRRQQPINLLK